MTHNPLTPQEIARKIDHTLLKPTLTLEELGVHCEEAQSFNFRTVCIPSGWVETAVDILGGTTVDVITVVGFPLGYSHRGAKAIETRMAIKDGAKEIDMVINLSFLKSGMHKEMAEDIQSVRIACEGTPLKVIIETAYLTKEEKILASKIAESEGATFVKTSTGFATGVPITGATLADIRLLRETLKPETKIKASGGIRDLPIALAMLNAGADRLGTSSGVAIYNGLKGDSSY